MIELIACVLIVINACGLVIGSIILNNMKVIINQLTHFIQNERYSASTEGDLAHRLSELQKMRFSSMNVRSQQHRIIKK